MAVEVDKTKCVGCGACVSIAPENFEFGDDGLSEVVNDEITENTRDAAESCPFGAIKIEEEN